MAVSYEWKVEFIDDFDDIQDYEHEEANAAGLSRAVIAAGKVADYLNCTRSRICLVRDEGGDVEGLQDREHAYIREGVLLNYESPISGEYDNYSPPKRYRLLVDNMAKRWGKK